MEVTIPTFKASATMVKLVSSATNTGRAKVVTCGVTGIPHGVSRQAGITGEMIAVDLFPGKNGTYEVETTISTAITIGKALYQGASGKLTDHATTNSYLVAIAISNAAASNDHIEVIPNNIVTFATTT